MTRGLSPLGLGFGLALATLGCREGGNNNFPQRDLAVAGGDLSGPRADLAAPLSDSGGGTDMAATPATVHEINTGKHSANSKVTVTGLVVTGITRFTGTSKSMRCQYEAFAQDPKGQAPSGIKLFASGKACTPRDGGSCFCEFPPSSGTALDEVMEFGDEVTVTGYVGIYAPTDADAGLLPPQHEISAVAVTKTGMGKTVTPVMGDAKLFAKNGAGYLMYENQIITVKPAQPATVSAMDKFGEWDFAGVHFKDLYSFVYRKGQNVDGGIFPTAGTTFTSITGIAVPSFGGGIAPRQPSDFVK